MKKITMIILAASLFFVMSCNNARTEDSKKVAKEQNDEKFEDSDIEDDAKFAVNAADASMLEIQLGILAQTKAYSSEAKELGRKMRDEHSKANNELKELADRKNITLPSSLSERAKDKYDFLLEKTGRDFDKAYSDFLVEDHRRVISAFEKEANKGKDAELKNWALGKLPTLKYNLEVSKGTQYELATTNDKDDKK